jgi:PST family polysaccharide transporter
VGIKLTDSGDRAIENSVFGKEFGAAALGSFGFAIQVSRFVCEAFSNAFWSALYIKTLRSGNDAETRMTYLRLLRLSGFVLFPIGAIMAVETPRIVPLILGPRWNDAILFIQFFLPTYAIAVTGTLGSAILYARGKSAVQLRITLETVGIRIAAVAVASWTGIGIFALCLGLSNIYTFGRSVSAAAREIEMPVSSLTAPLVRPAICAGLAALVCLGGELLLPASIGEIVLMTLLCAVAYLGLLLLIDKDALLKDIFDVINSIRGPGAAASASVPT